MRRTCSIAAKKVLAVFNFICNFLVYGFCVWVFFSLFDLLLKLEEKMGEWVDKITTPFYWLIDRCTHNWGGNTLMIGISLFSAGYVVYTFLTAVDILEPLLSVATGTTIGSVVYLIATDLDFQGYLNYAAPVAVAFSSFFAYTYMKFTILRLEKLNLNKVSRCILLILMNVIFIAFSSLLSEDMAIFFSKAAQWMNTQFTQLHSHVTNIQIDSFADVLPLIGNVLKLIPIALAGLIVLLITVREYFAGALYGIVCILALIVVALLISFIPLPVVGDLLAILAFLLVAYIRPDDTATSKFSQFFQKLSFLNILHDFFGIKTK